MSYNPYQLSDSYHFDNYKDDEQKTELNRLHLQATFAQELEKDFFKTQFPLPVQSNILEIGCGPGFVCGLLASIYHDSIVQGLDASEKLLDNANQIVAPKFNNLKFVKGSAYKTPFKDNTFDLIYNRMLYQHLDQPITALKEAHRILKPNGKVCVMDVDSSLQIVYPTCPAFDKLNALSCEKQNQIGGDRSIGRKLPHFFKEAGFEKINFQIVNVTSLNIDPQLLIDITTKFKALQIGTKEAKNLLKEIEDFFSNTVPKPILISGVFVCTGEK